MQLTMGMAAQKTLVQLRSIEMLLKLIDLELSEMALTAEKHRIEHINRIVAVNQRSLEGVLGLQLLIENEDV